MLASYFLLGTPMPKPVADRITTVGGPKAVSRASAALHMGLGFLMAAAIMVPLVTAADPDFPLRSRYTTLFAALGHATNAPVIKALYDLVQQAGPAVGYGVIAGVTALMGLILGVIGIQFATFKDRLYADLGPIKYAIVIGLFLMMFGVLGKITLRLLFGVKYLISWPAFSFNI